MKPQPRKTPQNLTKPHPRPLSTREGRKGGHNAALTQNTEGKIGEGNKRQTKQKDHAELTHCAVDGENSKKKAQNT